MSLLCKKCFSVSFFIFSLFINNGFAMEPRFITDSSKQAIYLDQGGMPRCVKSANSRVFFWWDTSENRYDREVYIVRPLRYFGNSCEDWEKFANSPGSLVKADVKLGRADLYVSKAPSSLQNISLSKEIRERLKQVRNGASVYRREKTGAEWLKNNPLKEYTLKTNAKLSAKYGIGFTGEIYKAFVESQPQNVQVKNEFIQKIEETKKDPAGSKKELNVLSKKVKLMVSLGLGWVRGKVMSGPYDVPRLEEDLKGIGLNYSVLDNLPFGRVKSNSQMLADQIKAELLQKNDVMLMGACKGTAELMNALSLIPDLVDANGKQNNPNYGRVTGVLSLSGLMKGSFLAEWITHLNNDSKFMNWLFRVLKEGPFVSMHDMGTIIGVAPDLSTTQMEKDYAYYSKRVPKDMVYFNALGVMPGNGRMADSPVAELQDKVIIPVMKYGNANDGYIDYPSSAIPDEMAPNNVYSVVFDASHMIVDGSFSGTWNKKPVTYQMRDKTTRRTVLGAMFTLFNDLSNQNR